MTVGDILDRTSVEVQAERTHIHYQLWEWKKGNWLNEQEVTSDILYLCERCRHFRWCDSGVGERHVNTGVTTRTK